MQNKQHETRSEIRQVLFAFDYSMCVTNSYYVPVNHFFVMLLFLVTHAFSEQINENFKIFDLSHIYDFEFSEQFIGSGVYIMFSNDMKSKKNYIDDGNDRTHFKNDAYLYRNVYFTIKEKTAKMHFPEVRGNTFCYIWIDDKPNRCGNNALVITGNKYFYKEFQMLESSQVCVFMPTTIQNAGTFIKWGYTAIQPDQAALYYLNSKLKVDTYNTTHQLEIQMDLPFYLQFTQQLANHIIIQRKRNDNSRTNFDDCGQYTFLKIDNGVEEMLYLATIHDDFICTPNNELWLKYKGIWITLIVVASIVYLVLLWCCCRKCCCCCCRKKNKYESIDTIPSAPIYDGTNANQYTFTPYTPIQNPISLTQEQAFQPNVLPEGPSYPEIE